VEDALKLMSGESGKFDKVLLQTLHDIFVKRTGSAVTPPNGTPMPGTEAA
jgi:hypothetical protein